MTTVVSVSRIPTISTLSPVFTIPCSTRPVTTVPRPVIENTSSIGIRKSLSSARSGSGIVVVQRLHQLVDARVRRIVAPESSKAFSAEPLMIGMSSPGKS